MDFWIIGLLEGEPTAREGLTRSTLNAGKTYMLTYFTLGLFSICFVPLAKDESPGSNGQSPKSNCDSGVL